MLDHLPGRSLGFPAVIGDDKVRNPAPVIPELELGGLADAADALGLREFLVLTYDQRETLEHDGRPVAVMPAWEWLLTPHLPTG